MKALEENLVMSGTGLCRRWPLRRALGVELPEAPMLAANQIRAWEELKELRGCWRSHGRVLKMVGGMAIFISERRLGS